MNSNKYKAEESSVSHPRKVAGKYVQNFGQFFLLLASISGFPLPEHG
jgi:hypothetical protein